MGLWPFLTNRHEHLSFILTHTGAKQVSLQCSVHKAVGPFVLLLFSRWVMSDSLRPQGPQHIWLPCPSLSPGACAHSCPFRWWCHPTISSSVVPFSLLPSIFPSIRVFSSESALTIRWPKYWSFSISPPMNIQCQFPLEWTCWISLQSKGFSRVFSNTTIQKHQFFGAQPS